MQLVYLPLDERPCNAVYPVQLAAISDLTLIVPPASILGKKKSPADCGKIGEWLEACAEGSDRFIVSLDMLVYGGIVPSRLHHLDRNVCDSRLQVLRRIKAANPAVRIYAFNLIMRAPAYNSSEEEPDYYEDHGRHLFRYGWLQDKREYDPLTEEEAAEWEQLAKILPANMLSDFLERRSINAFVNNEAVELTKEGIIDFLIIPLDDNARYGFTASEQRRLLFAVESNNLMDRIRIYPGADEIGCTLLAHVFCEVKGYSPSVFIRYSSTRGPYVIPKYEDRSLNESIKAHLSAAGAFVADSPQEADIVLMVHAPPIGQTEQAETSSRYDERHRSYYSETNLSEFVQAIRRYLDAGRTVALADVATCNGGDHALMKLAAKSGLLSGLAAYAGWNTSGNTIGTVVSHAIIASHSNRRLEAGAGNQSSDDFKLYRFIEDWGYQSIVRQDIVENDLPRLGGSYFELHGIQSDVVDLIREKLNRFVREELGEAAARRISVADVHLPWNRMFEVGFSLAE